MYILEIAAAELEAFKRMTKRAPRVDIKDWQEVEADVLTARGHSAHLWFPPNGRAPGGHLKLLHLWPGQTPPLEKRQDDWKLAV